jgi:TPR repeat protein
MKIDFKAMNNVDELTLMAEQGNCEAIFELILCYSHGDGVQKDKEKADYWDKRFTEKIEDCDIS